MSKRLLLANAESKTSRFLVRFLSETDSSILTDCGVLSFGRVDAESWIWEQLLRDDLIIGIANRQPTGLFLTALKVIGKTISSSETLERNRPFKVVCKELGRAHRNAVPWQALFNGDALGSPSRHVFQQMWESCAPVADGSASEPAPIFQNGYTITIAQSHQDYEYISRAAALHPFGIRQATITLVATEHGEYCGALLAEFSAKSQNTHKACWRVFRKDYLRLQSHGLYIARLYSRQPIMSRMRAHKALIEALIAVAPSLTAPPLAFIEGTSYDYHPAARLLGFNVEVPADIEGSFYYWKPFSVPSHVKVERDRAAEKRAIHHFLARRSPVHYWLARGRLQDIELAEQKCAWAIRRSPANTGLWRSLKRGDIVFLAGQDDRLRAYGRVVGTAIRHVRGMEEFPLWIDFDNRMVKRLDVPLGPVLAEHWYRNLPRAGLVLLPSEFGAFIKADADAIITEGKMWVEPNPFLLHRTDFTVALNQVFVVQPWSFRETVFPVIREILKQHGYEAVYAGDRDGQVVFEDIWLMLNESEYVIVDFTNRRPNVYLEYGMALVLGKPIIAITQDMDDIPSDTPNLKVIPYQDKLGDDSLSGSLPRALRDIASDLNTIRSARKGGKI